MNEQYEKGLECVDADVGEGILDLCLPALDADDRNLLEAHRDVCAHCRLTLDLHHRLEAGMRDGSLADVAPRAAHAGRRRGWTGWAAIAATAASLVCMAMLPPRPIGPALAGRGPDDTRFLSPVEGQVVGGGELDVAWTEVEGASSYGVRISDASGGSGWSDTSTEAALVVPADLELERGATYRILLQTVPADLLPPGGASVTFRTGSILDVMVHRARRAQPIAYLLALTGLSLAAVFAAVRRS